MTIITPDLIKSLIIKDGALYVPDTISDAIGSCTTSNADAIQEEYKDLKDKYVKFSRNLEPLAIDYSKAATIDSYSVHYLPRNTFVPKVAILCCAYHPSLQNLPDRLRVLDLGSGTGGVVLGLLDLFRNKALSGTRLDIVAIDESLECLNRQKELVKCIGTQGSSNQCQQANLSDPCSYQSKLSIGAPYDMVFAANIFAELDAQDAQATDAILEHVVPILSENGIVVNVESHSSLAMKRRSQMANSAKSLGLHMYYPCPPDLPCPKQECWMWRNDGFDCPDIIVDVETIETVKVHRAFWTILCRQSCSIYDVLRHNNPKLFWGVLAPKYKSREVEDKIEQNYEVCRIDGYKEITHKKKKGIFSIIQDPEFNRGSFIGYTDDYSEIEFWDIL